MSKATNELDERVLAAIRHHEALRFAQLCKVLGVDPTERGKSPAWRAIDRALQRLRKRGAIACAGTFWSAANGSDSAPVKRNRRRR